MRGKILLPRWRRLLEYLRATKRAPLRWSERVRCYMQIGRFVLSPSKLGGMAGDLLRAVKLALPVFGKHVSGSVSVDDNSLRRVA